MTIKEYSFNLPEELIAQSPSDKRGSDRLMVVNRATGAVVDSEMSDFVRYLEKDSILVVNNSKVRKARLYATSETGGTVEFLFLEENIDGSWQAMVTKAKRQHVGKRYTFGAGPLLFHAEIISENEDGTRTVRFQEEITEQFFQKLGHVPFHPISKGMMISRMRAATRPSTQSMKVRLQLRLQACTSLTRSWQALKRKGALSYPLPFMWDLEPSCLCEQRI